MNVIASCQDAASWHWSQHDDGSLPLPAQSTGQSGSRGGSGCSILPGYTSGSSAASGKGSRIVTSFVPSGNVASTCTFLIISGTPSITSSRLNNCRPESMMSLTVLPARACSKTYTVNRAITSG